MTSSKVQQSLSGTALTDPVRYPSSASFPVRTKRGFVLVLLTLLVPGSAQPLLQGADIGIEDLRLVHSPGFSKRDRAMIRSDSLVDAYSRADGRQEKPTT